MIIDKHHKNWMIFNTIIVIVALYFYIYNYNSSINGLRGSSPYGIICGILGMTSILFAGILYFRKRVPTLQIGRAEIWLRGHIWIGLLSLPLVHFHSGFQFNGTLAVVLMINFYMVILSGVFGLTLQQLLPSYIMMLNYEAIYDQIDRVIYKILDECDKTVEQVCKISNNNINQYDEMNDKNHFSNSHHETTVDSGIKNLETLYCEEIRPFLEYGNGKISDLLNKRQQESKFSHIRKLLPVDMHHVVNLLESSYEKRCQLIIQSKLQMWLNGWLFLHIPLSASFFILSAGHITFAIKYSPL